MSTRHAGIRKATDDKIQQATIDIALEQGLPAVTIDAVAKESGVAKTTIYRRYDNSEQLLEGVADSIEFTCPKAIAEPTSEALAQMITAMRNALEARFGLSRLARALGSQARFHKILTDKIVRPTTVELLEFFHLGVKKRAFRPDADYSIVVDAIIGALVMRASLTGDVPEQWPQQLVATFWPAIVRAPEPAGDPQDAVIAPA